MVDQFYIVPTKSKCAPRVYYFVFEVIINICVNSNVAEVPNLRAYSLQTNQSQSLNDSQQHPAMILLRVEKVIKYFSRNWQL